MGPVSYTHLDVYKRQLQELADVFAITSNKFWWVEDNEYDYEKGTKEYQEARKIGSINFGVGGNQRLFLLSIKKET